MRLLFPFYRYPRVCMCVCEIFITVGYGQSVENRHSAHDMQLSPPPVFTFPIVWLFWKASPH